ncbi:hypothetical protein V4C56_15890 [Paraburkholderia azotifigens]|uniref:Uncharacterized protein n=1 Tax=Paraburkholderia azotifigens TaxID=2057004 RepID=A0ABU9R268_9BURK
MQPIDIFRIQRALPNAGKIDNPFGAVVRHPLVTVPPAFPALAALPEQTDEIQRPA